MAEGKKFYVLKDGAITGHFVGDQVELVGHSDALIEQLKDEGAIGTKAPKETDAEVPPVNEADASLPPERRSAEATGQPNPPDNEEDASPKRGRPRNEP